MLLRRQAILLLVLLSFVWAQCLLASHHHDSDAHGYLDTECAWCIFTTNNDFIIAVVVLSIGAAILRLQLCFSGQQHTIIPFTHYFLRAPPQ